ncbi:MAG: PH domain-containing protein [Acidimicrobiia bacterium]|nr:PH domain-containing protein [Acidimicrobiia bacterium]
MGLRERLRRLESSTVDDLFAGRLERIVGPTGERVLFVHRRHWLALAVPAALVVAGCVALVLADQPRTWLVVLAGSTILLDRWRRGLSTVRTAVAAAPWLVALWLTRDLTTSLFKAGAAVALLLFLLLVIARWWSEALVLTETSLWKLSGVVTTASPKAPLTQILFQDVRQNVVEQALGCGTLSFDTAGASDDPLARFGPIHEPFVVSAEISRQRLRSSVAGRGGPPPPPPVP